MRTPVLWLLGVLSLTGVVTARAQAAPDASGDPPARVARLALVEGSVSMQPAGTSDWTAAPLNEPLTQGDALWSDTGSRAEVDLGVARIRLDQLSSLSISDLEDRSVQLRLQAGSIDVAVSDVADLDWFEIDAPSAAVSILRPGEYRFTVDNASTTSIAVRSGQAQVQGSDPHDPAAPGAQVSTGQRALFGSNGAYAIMQAAPPDAFDLWCQQRQAVWNQEQAVARYVSSDAVGYQDLNDYGQWQPEGDDGYVWFPSDVPVDWVPYSTGHWVWITRWGWTWVDDAPWGFAPFHYGRWRHYGNRWGWIPSPPHQRTVYAPAVVAWIGGPGAPGAPSLGGGPAVGWLPLAPGEVFIPAYAASPRYVRILNLSNSRRLSAAQIDGVAANPAQQNRYENQAVPGALTVIPQVSFTSGQSVARHRMSAPPQWQSLAAMARAPGITPEHASVVGALTLSHISTPPGMVLARPALAHHTPPLPPPSFERQVAAIQANGGRPLDAAQLIALRRVPVPSARERSGEIAPFQAPTQNVFERRTREIEQERAEEQQAQQPRRTAPGKFQTQPESPSAPAPSLSRPVNPQAPAPLQRPVQQQPVAPPAGVEPPARTSAHPEYRRIPEPVSPNSAR